MFETSHRAKDGRRIPVEIHVKHLSFEGHEYHCAFVRDITERKRAEAERTRLMAVLEVSLNEIYMFDTDTLRFTYVNRGARENLGYTLEALRKLTPLDLKPEFTDTTFRAHIAPLLRHEQSQLVFQTLHKRANGTFYPVEVHLQLVELGNQRQFLAIIFDITERKQAEKALRQSLERFDLAVQGAHAGLWDAVAVSEDYFNPANPMYYSPRMKEIMGVDDTAPDTIGTWAALVHPDDRERVFAALIAHLAQRVPYDIEYRIIMKTGECRWIAAKGQALWDETGRPLRMAGSFSDITERKRAETALWESKERFHTLADAMPQQVWTADPDGSLDYVNQRVLDYFGRPFDQMIGWGWEQVLHPDDLPECRARWARALKTGEPYEIEFRLLRASDGSHRWHLGRALPLRDQAGRIVKWFGSNTDITERKQTEEALRHSEERFRASFRHAAVGMGLVDLTGRILEANQAFSDITGYSEEELKNLTFQDITHPDDRTANLALQQNAIEGKRESFAVEKRYIRKDGEIVWVRVSVGTIHDTQGRVTHTIGLIEDITDRRQLEEGLRQAQKMEAVGRLAGGIAHDFNNLLTVIGGCSNLLQRRIASHDPLNRYVRDIKASSDRAASLTQQLLAFSRRQVLEPKALCLNDCVLAMDPILRRLIGEHIELVLALSQDLGPVKADPGQIEQVIMNLALNARDSMEHGGRLTVSTVNAVFDQGDAGKPPSLPPGIYTQMTVADTGQGMDKATLAHLFEPFFTTKDVGKGTGLGLATVYGIVTQSGGAIWATSEPGQGATFTVCLPQTAQEMIRAPEPSPPSEAAHRSTRGSETILLAEDEDAVRTLARELLEGEGYRVLEARNGVEALALARREAGPIHLLLTDVVMPHMGGHALADRLSSDRPGLKVLYISGYPADPNLQQDILDGQAAFLPKPTLPEALLHKVRDVLDTPS